MITALMFCMWAGLIVLPLIVLELYTLRDKVRWLREHRAPSDGRDE